MSDDDFERTLWVGQECFVYKNVRRGPNGYTANDWKETDFIWKGRVRVTEEGEKCDVRLEDAATGALFATCHVNDELSKAVERVTDSSRYFVLRITNQGKHAHVGMGFRERNDAFDFNVALDDHVKFVERRRDEKLNPPKAFDAGPSLNLGLRQGETMKIDIKGRSGSTRLGNSGNTGFSGGGLLPPPPASGRQRRAVQQYQSQPVATTVVNTQWMDQLVQDTRAGQAQPVQSHNPTFDPLADFLG